MSKVINGVNVTGLMQTIDAVKADATVAKFRFRVHNEWLEGGHNRSTLNEIYGAGQLHHRAKSFEIHADEPIVLLGSDTAPNPSEFLLTALAACVTSSLVYHAAARGIKIEEVESQDHHMSVFYVPKSITGAAQASAHAGASVVVWIDDHGGH